MAISESQVDLLVAAADLPRLQRAWALSHVAREARYAVDYAASSDWTHAIELTKEGRALEVQIKAISGALAEADVRMALFGYFDYEHLLIDIERSDLDAVERLLWSDLQANRSFLPFVFGRRLYDKFDGLYPTDFVTELHASNAVELLRGLPVGVFQVARTIVGPMGFLESEALRYLPPTGSPLGLWYERVGRHSQLRKVALIPPEIGIVNAFALIGNAGRTLGLEHSPWARVLSRSCIGLPGSTIPSLPIVAFDCLSEAERRIALVACIKSEFGSNLRQQLQRLKGAESVRGTPQEIVGRLTDEERFQLLLLGSDKKLVETIDACCARKEIRIQRFELRVPRTRAPYPFVDSPETVELGTLGVRHTIGQPSVALAKLVMKVYSSTDRMDDLEWKIKSGDHGGVEVALANFVRTFGPLEAVRSLVVSSSRTVCSGICAELGTSQVDHSPDELAELICWKLGFNLPHVSEPLGSARKHIAELRTCVLGIESLEREEARAEVRRAGVNLFVDLEQVLQAVVAFIVWLLGSDHHSDTLLIYTESTAMLAVPKHLGEAVVSTDGGRYIWNADGRNVFSVIFAYLNRLRQWIGELLERDRTQHLRDEGVVALTRNPASFAFRHVQLWADCTRASLENIGTELAGIIRLIGNADIAGVRNGLDHYRDPGDFPNLDKLTAFPTRLEQVMEVIERARFFPKCYWVEKYEEDRYGHFDYTLIDYRDRKFVVSGPSHVLGLRMARILGAEKPVILAPVGLLGHPCSDLVFLIGADGPLSAYWKGFPRVRSSSAVSDGDSQEFVGRATERGP